MLFKLASASSPLPAILINTANTEIAATIAPTITATVDPKAKPTEDQREQLNLWAVPLIDNINAWTLKFVTGQKDVNKDWNEYVSSCKNLNVDNIVALTNEIYKKQ